MPLPNKSHWNTKAVGIIEDRPDLPECPIGFKKIYIAPEEDEILIDTDLLELQALYNEIKTPNYKYSQPSKLLGDWEKNYKSRKDADEKALAWCGFHTAGINSTWQALPRGVSIIRDIFEVLVRRGYKVNKKDKKEYFEICGERVSFYLKEIEEKVKITDPKRKTYSNYDLKPTGLLSLKVEDRWFKFEFKDKSVKLEDQIPNIVLKIEHISLENASDNYRSEVRREKAELDKAKKEEIEKLKEAELKKFQKVFVNARRLADAKKIRDYVQAVSESLVEGTDMQKFNEWKEWANNKADWYDPLVNRSDELLTEDDKDVFDYSKDDKDNWNYDYGYKSRKSFFEKQWWQ